MKKEVKETLEYIEDKDTYFWDVVSLFNNPADVKTLQKIFPDEAQFRFIKALVKSLESAYDFHDGDESEAHLDIRKEISELSEKLRHHRHDFSKQFSGKPEV